MDEYWHSSLLACDKFLSSPKIDINKDHYKKVSKTFKEIRPWVKYGWEMIIIVHEMTKRENPLNSKNKKYFINQYCQNCKKIIQDNSWLVEDLQKILDASRTYQINKDFDMWVNLHKPFHEVLDFIEKLKLHHIKTGIISTKGKLFSTRILNKLEIFPEFVFGYESGTKIEIAKNLSKQYEIIGFIEDRKNTLIDIKQDPETKKIPCFLAEWGYLKDSDKNSLPEGIRLLKLKNLKDLVAIS